MNPGKLAQARRFYHHVAQGCHLKPEDVSYMVQALEEAYDEIEKLEAFVILIARNYGESSHDNVRWQRDDYIKRAKELLDELY